MERTIAQRKTSALFNVFNLTTIPGDPLLTADNRDFVNFDRLANILENSTKTMNAILSREAERHASVVWSSNSAIGFETNAALDEQ